jgi:FMN phosphatase YigB (HAD superfamily)
MLRAALFDLDDTLLANDMDVFVPAYLESLSNYAQHLLPKAQFRAALLAGTEAMLQSEDPASTNREVFWQRFTSLTGVDSTDFEKRLIVFYREQFPKLASYTAPVAAAPDVIETCKQRELLLVVATNPLFPREAIEERVRWAGLEPSDFALLTSYETSRAAKPRQAYYRDILAAIGCTPETALMVGNDPGADTEPAKRVGMHTYLVPNASELRSGEQIASSQSTQRSLRSSTSHEPDGTLEDLLAKLRAGWEPGGVKP